MKTIYYLLALMVILVPVNLSAQSPKKYDAETSLKIPSYIYFCSPPFDVPGSFTAIRKSQYYYDEDDNKVFDGPVTIVGGYVRPDVVTSVNNFGKYKSTINVSANIINDSMEGPFNGTFTESQSSGQDNTLSFKLSVSADYKDGVISGRLHMDSNLKRNGKDDKSHWYLTSYESSSLKSIDIQTKGLTCKVNFDENGLATGEMTTDGVPFKVSKSIYTNIFKRKTGEISNCEEEQSEILSKYINGEYTLDDIIRAGYTIEKHENYQIGHDKFALSCLYLQTEDLGHFKEISFPIYILRRVDVLRSSEMMDLLNAPISWDIKYSNNKLYYHHGRQYYEVYAAKNDVEKFSKSLDSLAREEARAIADTCIKAALTGVNHPSWMFRGEIYNNIPDNFGPYGKVNYTIEGVEKIEDEYYVTALLECGIGEINGPRIRSIIVSVDMAIDYYDSQRFYVNLITNEVIPSDWDKYRNVKQSTLKALIDILESPSKYEQKSFANFKKYSSEIDCKAKSTVQESMVAVNELTHEIESFTSHNLKRQEVLRNHHEITTLLYAYPDDLKIYITNFMKFDCTWKPKMGESFWTPVDNFIEDTRSFVKKIKIIDANNSELGVSLKKAASGIYKAYKKYLSGVNLALPDDANSNILDEIIKIQENCRSLISQAGLKEFMKEIKEQKLSTISDIITYAQSSGLIK